MIKLKAVNRKKLVALACRKGVRKCIIDLDVARNSFVGLIHETILMDYTVK